MFLVGNYDQHDNDAYGHAMQWIINFECKKDRTFTYKDALQEK